ncbi:MAG TPA: response regulator transcription factor [Acidimicrobiales bacterium]|jgi:DNA-binding response OmpR family regulator|nr:response regulator transcription factor [Acidimicrobiales bacterium]
MDSTEAAGLTILNVEDDHDVIATVRRVLRRSGFNVVSTPDGDEAIRLFKEHHPDLVLLDVGLRKGDGWTVLERIRKVSDTPVLMLTGLSSERDVVRGLRSGADGYLTKPFGRAELLARVESLIRRASAPATTESEEEAPSAGYSDLVVDLDAHILMRGDKRIQLSPTEFRLFSAFVHHAGQVLSAGQLLQLAWDDNTGLGEERVKLMVARIRRKFGWPAGPSCPIQTITGFGYQYHPPES